MKEITRANMKRVKSVAQQEKVWWASKEMLDGEMRRQLTNHDRPKKRNDNASVSV